MSNQLTKKDLFEFGVILRTEIVDTLRTEIKESANYIRSEIKESANSLRDELRSDIKESANSLRDELRSEVKESVGSLRSEMKASAGSLRSEMKESAGSLCSEIQLLRTEMEESTLEILSVMNSYAGVVDARFDAMDSRFTRVEAGMVTKDYLDRKLWEVRSDMQISMKVHVEKMH